MASPKTWQGRHHDATVSRDQYGTVSYMARRDENVVAGGADTVKEAQKECDEYFGAKVEWLTE